MPFDVLAQLEGQGLAVSAPGPALGELRPQCIEAVLRNVLVEDDEVVEDGHEGNVDRISRSLMDRGAARAVAVIDPQNAALLGFARERRIRNRQHSQCRHGKRLHAPHDPLHIFRSQLADWHRGYHGAALGQPGRLKRGLAIRTKRNPRGGTCAPLGPSATFAIAPKCLT